MTRSSVDLPEPLGPSSAVSEPSSTATETPSSAWKSPKRLRHVVDCDHDWSFRGRSPVITSRVASAMSASSAEAA